MRLIYSQQAQHIQRRQYVQDLKSGRNRGAKWQNRVDGVTELKVFKDGAEATSY